MKMSFAGFFCDRRAIQVLPTYQVEQQELLHHVVLRGQHIAHDRDEERGELFSIEKGSDCFLHSVHLGLVIARL